jgi:hypothetical protein
MLSAVVAPVLLIGGWTVAAGLQPGSFNPVAGTISALAARDAADRWVMTLALGAVGACYVLTGLAEPAGSGSVRNWSAAARRWACLSASWPGYRCSGLWP